MLLSAHKAACGRLACPAQARQRQRAGRGVAVVRCLGMNDANTDAAQRERESGSSSAGNGAASITFGTSGTGTGRQPGEVLLDTYTIIERLGEGSSSVTYSARMPDGRRVAVKELSLGRLKNWKQFELFEREARTLKALSHPNIPNYVAYHEVDGCFLLVQELAQGLTLNELVKEGSRMSESDVEGIARDLLGTLAYLSSRRPPVIHRDIKPDNIVIEGGQAGGRSLLVDFGGVQEAVQVDANKFGTTIVGTAGYMAPEQFGGAATPAADLYSLGAVLLFALSGRNPNQFRSARLKLQFDDVTMGPKLKRIVGGFLEPITEDRLTAERALDVLDGKVKPEAAKAPSGKVTLPTADRERRREAAEEQYRLQRARQQDQFGTLDNLGMTQRVARPWRMAPSNRPTGSRVELTKADDILIMEVPPNGLSGDVLGTGAFATVWTAFVGVWTASAVASGAALFALFSIPFWLAGGGLIRDAARSALQRETLTISGDSWSATQDLAHLSADLAKALGTGFGTIGGSTAGLLGARIITTMIVNGEPRTAVEITEGVKTYQIAEGLKPIEQEWLVGQVNQHLESLGLSVDVENEREPSADVQIVNDRDRSRTWNRNSTWDD